VCHTDYGLANYILKKGYLIRQKERRIMEKHKYNVFTPCKNYKLLPKILYKKPKSFQEIIITLELISSFKHKPRISIIFPKILIQK
jgi:hypothetical protein